jgi:hypothetical protein
MRANQFALYVKRSTPLTPIYISVVKPFQSQLKYPKLDFKNGKIEVKGQIYFWWRPQLQFALYVKR